MKIARWCYERRALVVVVWIVGFVAINIAAGAAGNNWRAEFQSGGSESDRGIDLLEEYFPGEGQGQAGSIVVKADQGVDDPDVRAAFEGLMAIADANDGVSVVSPYSPQGAHQIAPFGPNAGIIAFATLDVEPDVTFDRSAAIGADLVDAIDQLDVDAQFEVGGQQFAEFNPPESEAIGLAFAVVVLIVAFGSVLAMGLPIAVALAGVGAGLAIMTLLSHVVQVPDFAQFVGAMIGIGVGIDYALFVVTRYRESLHAGQGPEVATIVSADTAGRAVIFAGLTVVVSLIGLLLIGLPFVAGLGISAAAVVAMTMLATTTLLPALLGYAQLRVEVTRWRGLIAAGLCAVGLLGVGLKIPALAVAFALALVVVVVGRFVPVLRREVPRREPTPPEQSIWYRWSHLIQDRPWPFLLAGTAILLFLAIPVGGLRLAFSDEGNFPEETTTRKAYDLVAQGFSPGANGPFVAVAAVGSDADRAAVEAVRAAVAAETDAGVLFTTPTEANDAGTGVRFIIIPSTAPQAEETEDLIRHLRNDVIPAAEADSGVEVLITGFVPASTDASAFMGSRSLVFFGVVLALSFLLLMAVFRSLLVPIKAVIMNALSIAAAYGVVVALFQWGHLGGITGVEPAPIEPFIPMMMFAIVFGLSMDYEVFLLSRIKEQYERTGHAKNSVADGLASTARVITAAAAIMVVVFGSFLLEDDRTVKLFGVGLSVAVLLDATLVRMLLVPATMELLGDRNWWIPKWLDRLLPAMHVEGAPDHDERVAELAAEIDGRTRATVPVTPPSVPVVAGAPASPNGPGARPARRRTEPLRSRPPSDV